MKQRTKFIVVAAVVVALMLVKPSASRAAALIKQLEEGNDPKLKAYLDVAGKPTIGYGSTWHYDLGRWVKMGDVITREQAERWLNDHVGEKRKLISDTVKVPLNTNQVDALVSFTYNIGSTAWKGSTFLKWLNEGRPKYEVANQFDVWNKVTNPVTGLKVYSQGLANRRQIEKQIFLS